MARGRDISFSLPASGLSSMANLCCSTSSICVPHFAEKGLAVWRYYLLNAFSGSVESGHCALKWAARTQQPKRCTSAWVSKPKHGTCLQKFFELPQLRYTATDL